MLTFKDAVAIDEYNFCDHNFFLNWVLFWSQQQQRTPENKYYSRKSSVFLPVKTSLKSF